MNEKQILTARFRDLAARTYQKDILTHTDFLTLAEQAVLADLKSGRFPEERLDPVPVILRGGFEEAERKIALFLPSYLDEDMIRSMEEAGEFPITCLHVRSGQAKFSDDLTHRDFLGALMNLGIERDRIGDILIEPDQSGAYIFVMTAMADLIAEELTRVRHTTVSAALVPFKECRVRPSFDLREGFISSERLDVILAMVYRLSRTKAQALIEAEAVSVDGRLMTGSGGTVKASSRVSVRGYGKFIYDGADGSSRKGKLHARVRVFK